VTVSCCTGEDEARYSEIKKNGTLRSATKSGQHERGCENVERSCAQQTRQNSATVKKVFMKTGSNSPAEADKRRSNDRAITRDSWERNDGFALKLRRAGQQQEEPISITKSFDWSEAVGSVARSLTTPDGVRKVEQAVDVRELCRMYCVGEKDGADDPKFLVR
jgi:hypothetical protein